MRNSAMSLAILMASLATSAAADDLIGSYVAYIGGEDLYNSSGKRLTEPAQILRQDRANYHRFGIAQQGDEGDAFFASADNRAAMETMLREGNIDPEARRIVVGGGATVFVRIYGSHGVGRSISVVAVR